MPKPTPVLSTIVRTGSHTHQCSKYNHSWTCQYTTKCHLEMIASAQQIIDEICPKCHNLQYGNYAS